MTITSATLLKLTTLNLSAEQMNGVLEILAEQEAAEEERKAGQRERTRRSRDRNVTVTSPSPLQDELGSPPRPLSPKPPNPHPPAPGYITTRARAGFAKPNGFARFWEAYPRKVGKGAAEKAYATALRIHGGPDPPAELLAALERVKPTWTDQQFIPHPSTWLNQHRWEDEPEPAKPNVRTKPTDRDDRLNAMLAGAMDALDGHEPGLRAGGGPGLDRVALRIAGGRGGP